MHGIWHDKPRYACDACKLSFPELKRLQAHLQTALCKQQPSLKRSSAAAFGEQQHESVCSKGCGYKTMYPSNLPAHEAKRHGSHWKCEYCPKETIMTSEAAFAIHLKNEHPVSDICSYVRCGYFNKKE